MRPTGVYYLRENLHRLSEEVAILADDLHSKDKSSQDTLNTLKECIRRISDEMSSLDSREEGEEE